MVPGMMVPRYRCYRNDSSESKDGAQGIVPGMMVPQEKLVPGMVPKVKKVPGMIVPKV